MLHIIDRVFGIGAFIACAALIAVGTGCRLPHSTTGAAGNLQQTRAAQFVIGSTLLQTAPAGRIPHQQATRYRELQNVTDMQASDALAMLAEIRNDPVKAKKLYDTIQSVLTSRSDTAVHNK